jgi:hypothetical protein
MVEMLMVEVVRRMPVAVGRQLPVLERDLDTMAEIRLRILAVMAVGFVVERVDLLPSPVAAAEAAAAVELVETVPLWLDQLERHTERVVEEAVWI